MPVGGWDVGDILIREGLKRDEIRLNRFGIPKSAYI